MTLYTRHCPSPSLLKNYDGAMTSKKRRSIAFAHKIPFVDSFFLSLVDGK